MKKILSMSLILVLFLTLVGLFSACEGSKNEGTQEVKDAEAREYGAAVEQFMDFAFLCKREEEDIFSIAPRTYWEKEADNKYDGEISRMLHYFEEKTALQVEFYGEELKNRRVDYQIEDELKLSKEEYQEVIRKIEERDNVRYGQVSEGYSFRLNVTHTFFGEALEESYKTVALKMDGKWYLAVTVGEETAYWLVNVVNYDCLYF